MIVGCRPRVKIHPTKRPAFLAWALPKKSGATRPAPERRWHVARDDRQGIGVGHRSDTSWPPRALRQRTDARRTSRAGRLFTTWRLRAEVGRIGSDLLGREARGQVELEKSE